MTHGLKQRLEKREILVAPGVFDMVSLHIAALCGFDALYMTGFGVSASFLGLPDAGLTTYSDMRGRASAMASASPVPLIADGDTGFGGLLNVRHTVRGYEAAGVAAIQIEDQEFPKKCGHTQGRRVIPTGDMVKKIEVAVEARETSDFLIIARTDARSSLGLDEALRRCEAYAKAGADVLFVESPEAEEEMERICRHFDLPLVANMVPGGKTPVLSPKALEEMGFKIALFPVSALLAGSGAIKSALEALKSGTVPDPGMSFEEFNQMIGFPDVWAFDERHSGESS